ncbi:CapA family protein [Lentzea alba]|uniref:CapA family protein n=1 Tax=Lentzea alba TaxID=2714351 RepID=UPI0039BF4064
MAITIALAGDTMLGRGVAERLEAVEPNELFSGGVRSAIDRADLFVLNLECCVSSHGRPVAGRRFHFRAPPVAVKTLTALGVDCVTLANNHALDYGAPAFTDTLAHLAQAGIKVAGAGLDSAAAHAPVLLEHSDTRVAVLGITDHPREAAAGTDRPGVAYADLRFGVPEWLVRAIRELAARDHIVLVTPHWGPNMTREPVPHVRTAAQQLVDAGATLIAGHSAHVFHGVAWRILFDLGDFIDDYARDPFLRNDFGLLFLVTLDQRGPLELEAVPLSLGFGYTRLAHRDEARWIYDRFTKACAEFGTDVTQVEDRLVVRWRHR